MPRSSKEVIDQAIRENRPGEIICYAFAIVFVVCGVGALIVGAVRGEGLVASAGGVASALFWPSLQIAMKIRRQNIAIRMLESALDRADTAKDATDALRVFFENEFFDRGTKRDGNALR